MKFRIALFSRIIGFFAGASLLFFAPNGDFSGANEPNAAKIGSEPQIFSNVSSENRALPIETAPPTRLADVVSETANGERANNNDKTAKTVAPFERSININGETPSTPLPLGRRAAERIAAERRAARKNAPLTAAPTTRRFADSQAERGEIPELETAPPNVVRRAVFPDDFVFLEAPNGLRILLKRTNERRAAVRIFAPEAGTLGEREFSGSGIARLTAELVASGATRRRPIGAPSDRDVAFRWETDAEGTLFSLDVGAENLSPALAWALDVATRPTFDETTFAKALENWTARIAASKRNRDEFVESATAETVYFSSPLREPSVGRLDRARRPTLADVRAFYSTRYSANNLIVAVAGPIEPESTAREILTACGAARRSVAFYFGDVPREPRQVSRREFVAEFPGPNAVLTLVWPTVDATDPDSPAFDALAEILTGGPNARLPQRVADGTLPALEVVASTTAPSRGGPGTFQIRATVAPENWALVESALVAETRRLGAEPISDAELNAAKKRLEAAAEARNADSNAALEAAVRSTAATGDPNFANERLKTAARIDAETARRVARERLGAVYSRIAVVPPNASEAANKATRSAKRR